MKERIKTLVIEDNPADVELLKIAFAEKGIDTEIIVKNDGDKALAYLKDLQSEIEGVLPKVILLDLNLPKKSGKEVLKVIKSDNDLKKLPVIVMSTSNVKEDVEQCYQLYANSYLVKPADFNHFLELVDVLKSYWYDQSILP